MTIEAWPFLVGGNKKLDYQTIVCPRFLSEVGLALLLAEAAGGDVSAPDSATYREILGSPVGDISLVFRVFKAIAQDYGLGGDEILRDRSGRSIRLIEGFVVQGRKSGLPVTQNDLQITHEMVKGVYHDFWQAQTTFQEISSSPFELPAESQGAQQLQLIEEEPLDLRSHSRKAVESLINLGQAEMAFRNRPPRSGEPPAGNQESQLQQPIKEKPSRLRSRNAVEPLLGPAQHGRLQRRWLLVALVALLVLSSVGVWLFIVITTPSPAKILSTFCSNLLAAQPNYNDAYNELSTKVKKSLDEPNFAGFFTIHSVKTCSAQLQDNASATLSISYQDRISVSIPINLQEEQGTWKIATDIVNELQQKKT